jgi:phosphoenolpyruvate carboxykinase (GTP)
MTRETLDTLFEVKNEHWKKEIEEVEAFYAQFGERLPKELTSQLMDLKKQIG